MFPLSTIIQLSLYHILLIILLCNNINIVSSASNIILGGGSSLSLRFYTDTQFAYQLNNPAFTFNYLSRGSSAGRTGIINGEFNFAGSDSPMGATQNINNIIAIPV